MSNLQSQLDEKTAAIREHVRKALGYATEGALNIVDRHRLDSEVEQLIEEFEESLICGETARAARNAPNASEAVALWRRHDMRLSENEFGRLMQEHHEVLEQIEQKMWDNAAQTKKAAKR